MKKFFKKKLQPSVKGLQREIAEVREKHSAEVDAMIERFTRARYELVETLNRERQMRGAAEQAVEHNARLVKYLEEKVTITSQSLEIERMELMARAARLEMRIKGLGV